MKYKELDENTNPQESEYSIRDIPHIGTSGE